MDSASARSTATSSSARSRRSNILLRRDESDDCDVASRASNVDAHAVCYTKELVGPKPKQNHDRRMQEPNDHKRRLFTRRSQLRGGGNNHSVDFGDIQQGDLHEADIMSSTSSRSYTRDQHESSSAVVQSHLSVSQPSSPKQSQLILQYSSGLRHPTISNMAGGSVGSPSHTSASSISSYHHQNHHHQEDHNAHHNISSSSGSYRSTAIRRSRSRLGNTTATSVATASDSTLEPTDNQQNAELSFDVIASSGERSSYSSRSSNDVQEAMLRTSNIGSLLPSQRNIVTSLSSTSSSVLVHGSRARALSSSTSSSSSLSLLRAASHRLLQRLSTPAATSDNSWTESARPVEYYGGDSVFDIETGNEPAANFHLSQELTTPGGHYRRNEYCSSDVTPMPTTSLRLSNLSRQSSEVVSSILGSLGPVVTAPSSNSLDASLSSAKFRLRNSAANASASSSRSTRHLAKEPYGTSSDKEFSKDLSSSSHSFLSAGEYSGQYDAYPPTTGRTAVRHSDDFAASVCFEDSCMFRFAEPAPSHMDILPDDLLLLIFSKLESARQVAVASSVCTRWNAVASSTDTLCFNRLQLPGSKVEEVVSRMVLRSVGLRRLEIEAMGRVDEDKRPSSGAGATGPDESSHGHAREFIVEAWARHTGATLEELHMSYLRCAGCLRTTTRSGSASTADGQIGDSRDRLPAARSRTRRPHSTSHVPMRQQAGGDPGERGNYGNDSVGPSASTVTGGPLTVYAGGRDFSLHLRHLARHCRVLKSLKLGSITLTEASMKRCFRSSEQSPHTWATTPTSTGNGTSRPSTSCQFRRLESLSLEWANSSSAALQLLLDSCPSLRRLSIFMGTGFTDSTLVLRLPNTVEEVDLAYLRVNAIHITGGKGLRSLTIKDMFLTTLTVDESCKALSKVSVATAAAFSLRATCPALQVVEMKAGAVVWDDLTRAMESSGASLHSLSIDYFTPTMPAESNFFGSENFGRQTPRLPRPLDLEWLSQTCPNLASLQLGPLPWECLLGTRVSPSGNLSLFTPRNVRTWPNLKEFMVKVNGRTNASLLWLGAILKNCPNLESMGVLTSMEDDGPEESAAASPDSCDFFYSAILSLQRRYKSVKISLPVYYRQDR